MHFSPFYKLKKEHALKVNRYFHLFLSAAVCMLTACSDPQSNSRKTGLITGLKDLHGKKAASLTGSTFQEYAEKTAPDSKITVASTVGLPLESSISLAYISFISEL